jgi:hypothetical protein
MPSMSAVRPVRARWLLSAVLAFLLGCSSNQGPSAAAGGGGAAGTGGATGGTAGTGGTQASGAGGGAGSPCIDELPLLEVAPATLSETGLYDATGQLEPWVQTFEPTYVLWSDAADKLRYVYVPKCSPIDTSDMDHWNFPVGTRAWKQFSRNGQRIETRLIHKNGPGLADWVFAAYEWNATDTDADFVPDGVIDAKGTTHNIPSVNDCIQCHGKLPERLLGFSAIQLTHDATGVNSATMRTLSDAGRLSVPAPDGFTVPGATPATKSAIGYLHANCGNCHNSSFLLTDLRMRVLTTQTAVVDTDVYTTAVNVASVNFPCTCNRITPGNPAQSAVMQRMSSRVAGAQMPPLGTEITDPTGIQTVTDWITALGTTGGGL